MNRIVSILQPTIARGRSAVIPHSSLSRSATRCAVSPPTSSYRSGASSLGFARKRRPLVVHKVSKSQQSAQRVECLRLVDRASHAV